MSDIEKARQKFEAEITDLKGAVAKLQGQVEELLALIEELADPDQCHYDHHGYCQTHNLDEKPCPHERARQILMKGAREK